MAIIAVTVPKWGLTMEEGTLVTWLKAAGDTVEKGEEIAEVESSKIANALEAPASGTLRRLVAAEGDVLPVGGLLAIITDADDSDADIDTFVAGFVVEAPDEEESAAAAPQFASVDGLEIAYVALGASDGPAILLIHGFGGDRNNWLFNQQALADGRRVIAMDLPGHGLSAKAISDVSLGGLARPASAVLAAEGVARAVLVGHSLGAAVALTLASMEPDRIAGVVALCGAGLGQPVNAAYVTAFLEAERRKDMKAAAGMLFADADLVTRDLVEDLLRFKRTDGVQAALAAIAAGAVREADAADLSAGLAQPVVRLWGGRDSIIAAGGQGETLPDIGHMPHMEAASAVNAAIAALVQDIA